MPADRRALPIAGVKYVVVGIPTPSPSLSVRYKGTPTLMVPPERMAMEPPEKEMEPTARVWSYITVRLPPDPICS